MDTLGRNLASLGVRMYNPTSNNREPSKSLSFRLGVLRSTTERLCPFLTYFPPGAKKVSVQWDMNWITRKFLGPLVQGFGVAVLGVFLH